MIPKPKHCNQNWSAMKRTDGGRICGQCNKIIIDFSKMTWSDIEQIQTRNNNSVCGLYSSKQIDNWGRQVPQKSCSKFSATAALLVSLITAAQTNGQTIEKTVPTTRTIVRGNVIGTTQQNETEILGFTFIKLKGTKINAITDENGYYQLDITDYLDTLLNPTLVYTMVGYNNLELELDNCLQGEFNYDAHLNQEGIIYDYFYITNVSWKIRFKSRIRNIFR